MAINNENGSVKSSVSLSITIHVIIVGLLLFSPQIKELPLIKDLIGARTSTDMNLEAAIGSSEEVTVAYVKPEKNNIKQINSAKDSIEVKEDTPSKIEKNEVPSIPEKQISKSKVKKMFAKSNIEPSDLKEPKKDNLEKDDIDLEKELDNRLDDIADEDKKIDDEEQLAEQSPKLFKNPNPGPEVDHTLGSTNGFKDRTEFVRDGRKLKQVAGNPIPVYPSSARLTKNQGTVLLKYLVTDSGSVTDIRVIQSSGSPELDNEAVNKIQRWKFQPGQAGETTHPVTFKLNGPSEQLPSRLRTTSKNG